MARKLTAVQLLNVLSSVAEEVGAADLSDRLLEIQEEFAEALETVELVAEARLGLRMEVSE